MEGKNVPETKSEDAAESNTKAEHKLIFLNRNQDSADSSPQKEKQDVVAAHVPFKRRRGRPSRVIKKPRKYLDSYVEEYMKSGSPEPSENDNNEENSEEEDMEGKDKEEGEEERQGEAEGVESKGETMNKGETTEGAGESDGEQRTECAKCGKRFSNVSNCQRHINKDQCGRQHHCPFCETPFDTRALLDSHIESHRDEHNQNSYRCGDCNRAYITLNGYLKHKRMGTCYKRDVFHEDGTKGDFECPLCHVRFTTEKLLALHTEKVHENPNNEYKCPDCSRVFYSKVGFNKHIAKKSCTQPHVCKVCGKKYSNKAKESFKSHMRYHLAETSGVQFQCEDCGRVYMTDMSLRKHRLTSHTNKRPYKCSTCSKTFHMRYMVRDHERSHTGEKPFLCSLCGTSFSNRGHLYRHMRSHTLGTLNKRGRPRKYPAVSRPVLFNLKDAATAVEEVFEELGEREEETAGGELGVVEIKTDPIPQDAVQDLGSLGSGPTYITVHTIDGQLTDPTATQNIIGEGQLQHVVMETPDGMSDNMVLQVIRDLTGATTVYQHISAEQPLVASADSVVQAHPPQIVLSAVPPAQPGRDHPASVVVVEPGVSADSTEQQAMVVGGQQLLHSHGQPHPLMGAPPHPPLTPHTLHT
ncbi:hypothetical protein ACOMHN_018621 [Nucella lapillus]